MRHSAPKLVPMSNGANKEIVGSSVRRVAISFFPVIDPANPPGRTVVTIGAKALTGQLDTEAAFQITYLDAASFITPAIPITLTLETHGEIVQHDWHGWASSSNLWVGIIETLDDGQGANDKKLPES